MGIYLLERAIFVNRFSSIYGLEDVKLALMDDFYDIQCR